MIVRDDGVSRFASPAGIHNGSRIRFRQHSRYLRRVRRWARPLDGGHLAFTRFIGGWHASRSRPLWNSVVPLLSATFYPAINFRFKPTVRCRAQFERSWKLLGLYQTMQMLSAEADALDGPEF